MGLLLTVALQWGAYGITMGRHNSAAFTCS